MFFHYSRAYDRVLAIKCREADTHWRHTDVNDDEFIVQAANENEALDAARRWIIIREDDDTNDMDGLHFMERDPHRMDRRAYTILDAM
jgi:pentose-5-phosphate-3-epimerase